MTPARAARSRPAVALGWLLFALALLVQLVVLYVPTGPGEPLFPHADKVIHVLVFAAPVALALAAGARAGWVVAAFALHAVLSEAVQWSLLPTRSGDIWDVAADLVGVALGWGLWVLLRGRPKRSG